MANNTGMKFGGRKEGTENRVTKDVRGCFLNLIEMNLDNMQKDIDSLEPKERVKALIELAKFVVPTLKAIDIKGNDESFKPIQVNIVYANND